ncbi:MAG: ATP-dependent DNA helicase RecG [Bacteroidetes bacterium]|nr:ATP-dependent DNA helicase RecG [Bacteroidota bacterium]
MSLQTPLIYLKGVGEARAEQLRKELNLDNCLDLIQFFPYRYIDRTDFKTVKQALELAAKLDEVKDVQLKGRLKNIHVVGLKRAKRLVATLDDGTSSIELVWFNSISWLQKTLKPETQYLVFGKPYFFNGNLNITHPEIEDAATSEFQLSGKIQPMYPGTEKLKARGINSKAIARYTRYLIDNLDEKELFEILPQPITDKYKLINRFEAYKQIHYPDSEAHLQHAIRRLKFEELFIDQIKLLRVKQYRHSTSIGFILKNIEHHFTNFFNNHLQFQLTEAQKRVLKEIRKDVLSGRQMNRLLQGDVGSGKTVVALLTMLMAIDNNFQSCLMAPTEILAQQHYAGIKELLAPLNIRVELLTGSVKGKQRKIIFADLEKGEIPILIGTHALIEDTVKFNNLGCVVIDEQHRFGVEQRAKLWAKNNIAPHILVMTATPIPRTLAMTYYGDLDVSVIDELPPGRKPIKTVHRKESERLQVFGFLKEQIKEGRQVFVIYPLIEESEKLDLNNLMEGIQAFERAFPRPQYQLSIMHGKMKPADKDFEMQRFVANNTQIMVSTTVIEVGVNVPNATVMIIENAERFGLAQLHQLRGRVGRGAHQSFCILMTGDKLNNDARTRIQTMIQTNDGFKISEVDMQLRGPGEIEGTRQSGAPNFKIANIATDEHIMREARLSAEDLLNEDGQFEKPENMALRKYLSEQKWKIKQWGKVS